MANNGHMLLAILVLCAIIILTRALPFLIGSFIKNNYIMQVIERDLPAYIMLLLVIYEMNIKNFTHYPFGIPSVLALCCVVIVHVWRRQTLLSLAIGTISFALLQALI